MSGGCEQTCTNTDGSFQCSCNDGFMLAPNNLDCIVSGKVITKRFRLVDCN